MQEEIAILFEKTGASLTERGVVYRDIFFYRGFMHALYLLPDYLTAIHLVGRAKTVEVVSVSASLVSYTRILEGIIKGIPTECIGVKTVIRDMNPSILIRNDPRVLESLLCGSVGDLCIDRPEEQLYLTQ